MKTPLSWNRGEYDWIPVDDTKPVSEWTFCLESKRIKGAIPVRKSSYLSWVLEPESPFSNHTRVFSLPPIEEEFWNSMMSGGDPAKVSFLFYFDKMVD